MAAEIKLWAERKAGELLREMPKRTGGDGMKARSHVESEVSPKLADLGIDHNQSSRWQAIASIPEDGANSKKIPDPGEGALQSGDYSGNDPLGMESRGSAIAPDRAGCPPEERDQGHEETTCPGR